jgi:hypothetical protein
MFDMKAVSPYACASRRELHSVIRDTHIDITFDGHRADLGGDLMLVAVQELLEHGAKAVVLSEVPDRERWWRSRSCARHNRSLRFLDDRRARLDQQR